MTGQAPKFALRLAFLASFAVYLLPVASVHVTAILGVALVVALSELASGPPGLGTALSMGTAVLLQALAGALVYWVLRRPAWPRLVGLAAAVPLFLIAVQFAYLWAIPVLVLVERDRAPEVGQLEVACTLPGFRVAQVRAGIGLGLERAAEAWVVRQDDRRVGVLTMPGCRVALAEGVSAGSSLPQVAPGGNILYQTYDKDRAAAAHWYQSRDRGPPLRLETPPGITYWSPVLSEDGTTIAWRERPPANQQDAGRHLRLHHLPSGAERTVALDPGREELLAFDQAGGVFVLHRYPNQVRAVDRAGTPLWGPITPPGTHNAGRGFRRLKDGWVAWDDYREDGRSRVVWSRPAGTGTHEVPLGRGITSLAVDPSGRLIAVSVTRSVSVGQIDDALFVLRTSDGSEVYRRRLPSYARAEIAFLGPSFLAVTRSYSGASRIEVLRLPEPSAAPGLGS